MGLTIHKKNNWMILERFEKKYIGDGYTVISAGKDDINLNEIISLELPYDELIRIKQIDAHVKRYRETGELPYLPCVLKSPNGKYSVNFGSEVIVTAKEVGLEKIETMVEVALPHRYLTDKDKTFISAIEVSREAVKEAINSCNRSRQSDIYDTFGIRSKEWDVMEKGFNGLCDVYDSMSRELRNYYKKIAIREGLISENDCEYE